MAANTLLTSIVTGGSNSHATVAEEANAWATDWVSQGVVGTVTANTGSGGSGSFCVNADASPDMGVTIKAGQAYVTATPSGQNSQVLRVRASTDYTAYTINANASGSTKYDWIYLSISAANANTPSASADDVASFVTSRSSSNTTDNGTPPTYGILLAVVTVANGASSITNSVISDRRSQSSLSVTGSSNATGWTSIAYTPSTVTYNGNRSYSLTFSSVDLTGTISPGQRLKLTRTSTAPTQCTSLNGTTQFWSKTTPAGTIGTATDDLTFYAKVKLSSYNGASNAIISKYNGTSGFSFYVNSSGQINISGFNAGAGNNRQVQTYQSIPVGKWVTVTASLDMSGWTTATNKIMIDGVDVPVSLSSNGTNPTSFVQAGNLEIGSQNGGTAPFAGKIAQAAVFNGNVSTITQATINSYDGQSLSGSETGNIGTWTFNGNGNDSTANANNLSANGSATATNADSPFSVNSFGTATGTTDYGIVTSATFSTNTTIVCQVPEANTIPTSGGVSAVAYSNQKVPYGFPAQRGKWRVQSLLVSQQNTGLIATTVVGNPGSFQLLTPIGDGILSYEVSVQENPASGNSCNFAVGFSTANNTMSILESVTTYNAASGSAAILSGGAGFFKSIDISLNAATTYYFNARNDLAVNATLYIPSTNAASSSAKIFWEPAHL